MRQGVFIKKCQSIFSDNDGVRYLPRQKFGSGLDIQAVSRADAGETRIFQRAERRQYADYKIMFLMDISGSMEWGEGSKSAIMIQAVHAMAYALTIAGAVVYGMSFNQKIRDVSRKQLFDLDVLTKLMKEHYKTGGCNRDGAAVKKATQVLKALPPSPAKIIIVFSDGCPACGDSNHETERGEHSMGQCGFLTYNVKKTRNEGIEILGVGIQDRNAEQYYGQRKSVTVFNLKELYSKTMTLLERNIRRG